MARCTSCRQEFNTKSMRVVRRMKICRSCYKLGPDKVFANIAARRDNAIIETAVNNLICPIGQKPVVLSEPDECTCECDAIHESDEIDEDTGRCVLT
jgi:hypothetical protein